MEPREWKTYARLRPLDNLEVLKARFYTHVYGRHYHNGYALGIILAGSETYDCNNKTNVAPKGSTVIVNPGEIHTGQASDRKNGWGYFMIYPHPSLVRTALVQLGIEDDRLPVFTESVMTDLDFARGMVRFMDAFETGDSELKLEAIFLELLNLLITRYAEFPKTISSNSAQAHKVNKVIEMLHHRYAEPLSLADLAGEVGTTAWSLLRWFKRQTGISPYLLQTRLRICHAKKALHNGLSPADTAALCGFADQSHMTKQFRRWIGITPGDVAGTTT